MASRSALPLVDLAVGYPFSYPGSAVLPNLTRPGATLWLVVSQMDDTAEGASADGQSSGGWTQRAGSSRNGTVFLGGCSVAGNSVTETMGPLTTPALVALFNESSPRRGCKPHQ